MDRLLYAEGGGTALISALVRIDNASNLRLGDEVPILNGWIGGGPLNVWAP